MKATSYILVAALTFIGFLIVFAPVSPVWSMVRDDVSKAVPELNVLSLSGSIWSGKGEVQFRQFPPSQVTWTISPFDLFGRTGRINITGVGEGHSLNAEAVITFTEGHIEIFEGKFNNIYISSISEPYGLTFSGDLSINDISLTAKKDGITDAHGTARWSGGRIFVAGKTQPLDLPPLDGKLSFEKQFLILDVTFQQLSVLRISLNKHGWAAIAIKGRFFDIANLARPDGTDPDETILLLEEKIL